MSFYVFLSLHTGKSSNDTKSRHSEHILISKYNYVKPQDLIAWCLNDAILNINDISTVPSELLVLDEQ